MTNPNYRQERAAYPARADFQAGSQRHDGAGLLQAKRAWIAHVLLLAKATGQAIPSAAGKGRQQQPARFAVVEQIAPAQAPSIRITLRSGDRIEIAAGVDAAAMLETILQVLRQDVRL